jgi:Transposase, Mutator family
MALSKSALSDLLDALRAGGDLDVVREALALVLQALIEAEAAQVIGADRYQRAETRTTYRNGSRSRLLSTKAGDVELRIPKLREGSFFPALLEPRRRIDRALLAVVMQAYVHGTSTRKVDDLVKALGIDSGTSKSEVSRICAELDGEVAAFRSRSLAHTSFPYVFFAGLPVQGAAPGTAAGHLAAGAGAAAQGGGAGGVLLGRDQLDRLRHRADHARPGDRRGGGDRAGVPDRAGHRRPVGHLDPVLPADHHRLPVGRRGVCRQQGQLRAQVGPGGRVGPADRLRADRGRERDQRVATLTTAVPALHQLVLPLSLAALVLIMWANLRGVRESGRIFAVPTSAHHPAGP